MTSRCDVCCLHFPCFYGVYQIGDV
jgi:hypothetical protein